MRTILACYSSRDHEDLHEEPSATAMMLRHQQQLIFANDRSKHIEHTLSEVSGTIFKRMQISPPAMRRYREGDAVQPASSPDKM